MLDFYLHPYIEPPLKATAKLIKPYNLSATTITVIGFVFAILSFLALMFGNYLNALLFILINRFIDGLDGVVAREREATGEANGVTDFGGYLDTILDFVFYNGFVFFFAFSRNDYHDALAAAWLLFSYAGTGSTFLAYAILAERRGLPDAAAVSEWTRQKGFHYLGGLAEGTETLIYMVIVCLLPALFMPLSIIFGILCWLTTASRIMAAFNSFGDLSEKPASAKKKKPAARKKAADDSSSG